MVAVDLGEAIYREIAGGRSPHTEIGGWAGALSFLLGQAGGSNRQLARDLGIGESTIRGWRSGRVPRGDRRGELVDAAHRMQRRQRLAAGREKRLRRPAAMDSVTVGGYIIVSDEPEERDIALGDYLADTLADDLVDAYLDGASLDELAETFAEGIDGAPFYEDAAHPDGPVGWDVTDLGGWA